MAFLIYILGCGLSGFVRILLVGFFLDLNLSFRSFLPGRRSIGCVGSIVAFLRGVVCLPTCLTGWINIFLLFFSSVTVIVVGVVILLVCIVIRDRVIVATVFVSWIILSIFRLFFLSF